MRRETECAQRQHQRESGQAKRTVLVFRLGWWLQEATDKRKVYFGSWLTGGGGWGTPTHSGEEGRLLVGAGQPVSVRANTPDTHFLQ